MVWVYDLGDYWEHLITVERVAAPSGVRLLDGEMSCPAENEHGNKRWQEDVLDLLPAWQDWDGPCLSASNKLKEILFRLLHTMVNLRESGQAENKVNNMRCSLYNPFDFDIEHHRCTNNVLSKSVFKHLVDYSQTAASGTCFEWHWPPT